MQFVFGPTRQALELAWYDGARTGFVVGFLLALLAGLALGYWFGLGAQRK